MQNFIAKLKQYAPYMVAIIFATELFNIAFENSWDSYYAVSSKADGINYFTYFLQSILYGLHYYTGGWLLVFLMTLAIVIWRPGIIASLPKKTVFFATAFFLLYLIFHSAVFTTEAHSSLMIGDGVKTMLYSILGFAGIITVVVAINIFLVYMFFLRSTNQTFKPKAILTKFFPALAFKKAAVVNPYNWSNESIVTAPTKFENTSMPKFIPTAETKKKPEIQMPLPLPTEAAEELLEEKIETPPVVVPAAKLDRSEEESKRLLHEYLTESQINLESNSPDAQYFQGIKKLLEDKLAEFKVAGRIINVLKGPVVDTFELELGAGVKVSRVTSVSEDLSLALSGAPIRIVFPLMGKTTVGIEVPRSPREIIYLTELLKGQEFVQNKLRIPLILGKNAFGDPVVEDLAAMPHMLVAGSTGAGKSVFINSILVSLLVKLDHKKLKLILIDPKQLELSLYSKLKHLVLPVMTTPSLASCALLWACEEMERRYTLMSQLGVRNIEGYNAKRSSVTGLEFLPFVVIIIDEFADLILSKHGKDIEINICRLAAKARASGIHLIVATQRPSVDVITGLIKSNFPTRVSFRVTSSIDSRTILNAMGAENLLGMGDMLYKTGVETIRVHSPYIHEDEIEKITSYFSTDVPTYDDEVLEFVEEKEAELEGNFSEKSGGADYGRSDDQDSLFQEAVDIVMQYKAASASMLQRRLKIGYNRAANLVELMEKRGIVGPQQGAKPRRVLSQDE